MSIAPSIPGPGTAAPRARRAFARLVLATTCLAATTVTAGGTRADEATAGRALCAEGLVLASGPPDAGLFSKDASLGVVAEWCEGYDARGHVFRSGPYRERYPNGRYRLEARYRDGALDGHILAFDEDGFLFVRGELRDGRWFGALSLLLPNGTPWFDATYAEGRLQGPVAMRHPDGALAAETRFSAGREQGLARSFYPTAFGGGLQSEVRVEADTPVGPHRLFDDEGTILAPLEPDHPLFATVAPIPTARPESTERTDRDADEATPVAAISAP